jgi:NADP-dependent 3-hydroxy acid dehydrogenase YdfG
MSRNSYQDKVVVITGGSSGIGFALAIEFVKQNARVVLIAQSKERLTSAQET